MQVRISVPLFILFLLVTVFFAWKDLPKRETETGVFGTRKTVTLSNGRKLVETHDPYSRIIHEAYRPDGTLSWQKIVGEDGDYRESRFDSTGRKWVKTGRYCADGKPQWERVYKPNGASWGTSYYEDGKTICTQTVWFHRDIQLSIRYCKDGKTIWWSHEGSFDDNEKVRVFYDANGRRTKRTFTIEYPNMEDENWGSLSEGDGPTPFCTHTYRDKDNKPLFRQHWSSMWPDGEDSVETLTQVDVFAEDGETIVTTLSFEPASMRDRTWVLKEIRTFNPDGEDEVNVFSPGDSTEDLVKPEWLEGFALPETHTGSKGDI